MSWNVFNKLLGSADPIWLFRVSIDGVDTFYTSRSRDFSTPIGVPNASFVSSTSWVAHGVAMQDILETVTPTKRNVSIIFPRNNQEISELLTSQVNKTVKITVWQGFESDPDNEYIQFFTGTVKQLQPSLLKIILICIDGSSDLDSYNISRVIQIPCPYLVFSDECGLSEPAFVLISPASSMTGNSVTIVGAASEADDYFRAGTLEYGGRRQTIKSHTGSSIVLSSDFPELKIALLSGPVAVSLLPGCTKALSYCNFFSNVENYGGFPELTKSPYDGNGIL